MKRFLTSWKEIAAYLGKGVRTVQRWERNLGLPVRRPDTSLRNVVFALPVELDAWVTAASLPDTALDGVNEATLRVRIKQLEFEVAELRRQLAEAQLEMTEQPLQSPIAQPVRQRASS
jgi:hypothetical protein